MRNLISLEKNRKALLAVFLIFVIGMGSGSLITVVAQLSPTNTFTISNGIYPSLGSYTVWRLNNTFYAAKDSYGLIPSWGKSTDAAFIFNNIPDNVRINIANGVYVCSSKVVGKNGQTYSGESMGAFENFTQGVNLVYVGSSVNSFFDFRGVRSFNLENLKLIDSSGNAAIGLWVGGAANDATKSKALVFRNIVVDGFASGIVGYTFGPDDSSIYDSYIGDASVVAIDHLSSQYHIFGSSIYSSAIGLRIYRSGGISADASMQLTGTVFSGNSINVDIIGNQSINELTFTGCWFENTATMILRTTGAQAGIFLGSVVFDNCIGTVNSNTFMDLSGRNIEVQWNSGELYPTNGVGASIITDGVGGTYQKLSISPLAGADLITYSDSNSGLRGVHSASLIFYFDSSLNGYTNPTYVSASWQGAFLSLVNPFSGYDIVKATVYYDWNPQSAAGAVALVFNSRFGVCQNSGVHEQDAVDITAFVRANMTAAGGQIGGVMHGNGSLAPIVYSIEIVYEW